MPEIELNNILNKHNNIKKEAKDKKKNKKQKTKYDPNIKLYELFNILDKEKIDIYKKPWNKLDKGAKLFKLNEYCIHIKNTENLSDKTFNNLKQLLNISLYKGLFNKQASINYDEETGSINNINILHIDELNQYYIDNPDNNHKYNFKLKSNLDKYLII